MSLRLATYRMDLVAATGPLVRAEIAGAEALGSELGVQVPRSWPPPLTADVMELHATELEKDPDQAGWRLWYWIAREGPAGAAVAIGAGGFKGRPGPQGRVDVGYSVLPEFEGRGYASEAVAALLEWAFSHEEVSYLVGETYPDLTGSIRVLEKNGFVLTGAGSEAGVMRYELTRARFSRSRP